jgi:four helix bundle protein
MGSAYEVEYHALLSKELGFIKADAYERLQVQIVEVKRMLVALLVKVRADR